jgi:hypothetical protein
MADNVALAPRHLIEAARVARETLTPAANSDWSAKAGVLDWDCRATLDHMVNAPLFHGTNLAMRSRQRLSSPRAGNPTASIGDLIAAVEHSATILARVAEASPPEARGFHPGGIADAQGFVALSTNELLLHTHDIAQGLGIAFAPPSELAGLVVGRLFPWAPADVEPWAALLWVTARGSLPGRPAGDGSWQSHPAPLSEWDGTIPRRR